jgi:hypothetical protein
MEFDTYILLRNLSRKCNFHLHLTRIRGTLREDLGIFMKRSRLIILRLGNVTDKILQKLKHQLYVPFFS